MNKLRSSRLSQVVMAFVGAGSLALVMGTATEASAQTTFVPAVYQGIIQSDSNNDESFGFITISLVKTGVFSMRFNLGVNSIGRHSYAMTGRFNSNGVYHFEGPEVRDTRYAAARIIDLQLNTDGDATSIKGTVTDLTHSSVIELEKIARFTSVNPAPQAGRYTFLFAHPGADGVPTGSGFGAVVVSRSGAIAASGRSPDGRPFAQTAAVTESGRWPVFAKMTGTTKGILSGWLTFEEKAETDFSGQLTWLGPEVPGPNHAFVPQFTGDTQVLGSRYVAPERRRVFDASDATNNVHMTLSDGGLVANVERDLTLSTANKFTFTDRQRYDSLAVTPSTGLFAGTFLHSDNRVVTFRGAILQKGNRGAGNFTDRNQEIGNVSLRPQ